MTEMWDYFCEGCRIIAEGLLTVLTWLVWAVFVAGIAAAALAGALSMAAAVWEAAS